MPRGINLQGKTRASGDLWKASTDYTGGYVRYCGIKSVQPLQSENYSNSRVHGQGRVKKAVTSLRCFVFKQKVVLKRSFQKGDTESVGTRGVRKKGTWEVCLNVLSRGD